MFSFARIALYKNVARVNGAGWLRAENHVANAGGGFAARTITTSNDVKNSEVLLAKPETKNLANEMKETVGENHKIKKRTLSTINRSVPVVANSTAVSKEESREFMSVFPDLVRDITEKAKKYDSKDASRWLARALQYNVPRGKKNRGLVTVLAYKKLVPKDQLTAENLRRVQFLGWCVEMLQSIFLITDDIMDQSETRRGQPCWYKHEDVGLIAINDSLMIENFIFYILKKHFEKTDYYVKLMEMFHEAMIITTIGQSLDLQTANKDVTCFTMDRYKTIVHHKSSFYTFYLPVALSMHMAGYDDPEIFRQAKTILFEAGYFFQVQDDFLDCFGDPEVTGKIGTDIQDNKCTWLSALCMQRASNAQKEIMKQCYGHSDVDKVQQVKQLYEELGLPHTFALYEEESYNLIKTHIQQTSRGIPHAIFFQIMDKIYRRES